MSKADYCEGNMLKILIVDDETKVCWLLEQVIEWETLQAECIGMVSNGVEAYRFIEEHKPDVVITDIRMPDMDGLELVQKVKQIHADCTFVIISGYQQFEYAHAAIKYGVADFLLKPIDKEEINGVIKRIAKQRAQRDQMYSAFLKEQKDNKVKEREKRVVLENLLNDEGVSDHTIEFLKNAYSDGIWMCLGIRIDLKLQKITEEEEDFYHTRAWNVMKGEIPTDLMNYGLYDHGLLIVILNGEERALLEQQPLKEYRSIVHKDLLAFGECDVTFGVSEMTKGIQNLNRCVKQACSLLEARIAGDAGNVILFSNVMTGRETQLLLRPTDINRYQNVLETLNKEECEEVVRECIGRLELTDIADQYGSVMYSLRWLKDEYIRVLKKLSFVTDEDREKDKKYLQLSIRNGNRLSEIKKTISRYIGERIVEYHRQKVEMDSRPVLLARQYVSEHPSGDCSLQEVADFVGLSPTYLSVIFSEETGMTFKDFVVNTKIAKAKQLLIHTDDKINVISEKVGYKDAKYFSRVFEKKVNLKPAQYRKIMR